jgi:hypothetical protein
VFFGHLDFFLWKSSVQFICPFLHWIIVFWALCIFWLLILCQMYGWQRFSPILWAASAIWWSFLLFFRRLLVSCSLICNPFFLNESFEFYLGSHCLCILIPAYSLFFPALVSKFQVLY